MSRARLRAAARRRSSRRLAVYAVFAVLPWSLVEARGVVTVVFPFGLLNFAPLQLTDVVSYTTVLTGGLPRFLFAWPVGVGLYGLGLASAAAGAVWGREDRRLTAALLVLAGLTQAQLAAGFSRRAGTTALPLGAALLVLAVWWYDWPAVRQTVTGRG